MLNRFFIALSAVFLLVNAPSLEAQELYSEIDTDTHFYIAPPAGELKNILRWNPKRVALVSPHRGGPMPGYPENAIETFENATRYGPVILEVDVATLGDGTLILMHDSKLDRTTSGSGWVSDANWAAAKNLFLRDNNGTTTTYRIPKLSQALSWAVGRAILNLDIKKNTDFTKVYAEVITAGATEHVMAISYNLQQAVMLNKIAPDMMISVRIRNAEDLNAVKKAGLPLNRVVAWAGRELRSEETYRLLHEHGIMVMQGTLGFDDTSLDHQIMLAGNDRAYMTILGLGADIIATDRHWAAQKAIRFPSLVYFYRGKPNKSIN